MEVLKSEGGVGGGASWAPGLALLHDLCITWGAPCNYCIVRVLLDQKQRVDCASRVHVQYTVYV